MVHAALMKDGKAVETLREWTLALTTASSPLARSLGIAIPTQRSYVFSGTTQDPQLAFF